MLHQHDIILKIFNASNAMLLNLVCAWDCTTASTAPHAMVITNIICKNSTKFSPKFTYCSVKFSNLQNSVF